MTTDEQEALSFRYIAPRVFRLSSGNIAILDMIGLSPPTIIEPKDFPTLVSMLPTMEELEAQHQRAQASQRARATPVPSRPKANLDDLI